MPYGTKASATCAASPMESIMHRPFLTLLPAAASLSAQTARQTTGRALAARRPPGKPPLRDVRVSTGSATPAPWEKDPAVRERLRSTSCFPVRWWEWREIDRQLHTGEDGTVDWSLNGPWERKNMAPSGARKCSGTTLPPKERRSTTAGFEETPEKGPLEWESGGRRIPSPPDAWPLTAAEPLSGKAVAASWCQRPLNQTLQLKAGRKVILKLSCQSRHPPDFVAPKRLPETTPAHRAIARLKRGVNLGNGWEAPAGSGMGPSFTTEDIDRIADEGFDHIRVPVAWHHHLKRRRTAYEIDTALLAEIEPVLHRALDQKLHVLLDWHHFHDFTAHLPRSQGPLRQLWEIIARHFRSWPSELFLELLNEPRDALTTEIAQSTSIRRPSPPSAGSTRSASSSSARATGATSANSTNSACPMATTGSSSPSIVTSPSISPIKERAGCGCQAVPRHRLSGTAADSIRHSGFPQGRHRHPGLRGGYNTLPSALNPSSAKPALDFWMRSRLVPPFRQAGASRRVRQPQRRATRRAARAIPRTSEPSPKPAASRGRCGIGKPPLAIGTRRTTGPLFRNALFD